MNAGATASAVMTMIATMKRTASSMAPLSRRDRLVGLAFRAALAPALFSMCTRTLVRVRNPAFMKKRVHCDIQLSRRQRQRLAIVVEHVLDLNRVGSDLYDFVASIDDLSFLGDEDVVALGQEDLLGPSLVAAESVKL